jgi:hypothetical protein
VSERQRVASSVFVIQNMTEGPSAKVDRRLPRWGPVEIFERKPCFATHDSTSLESAWREILSWKLNPRSKAGYFCPQTKVRARSTNPPSAGCPN